MSTATFEAIGFDPAPGMPDRVAELVTTLSGVGGRLEQAHATLTRLGRSEGVWEGQAATAFAGRLGELPKYLDEGQRSLLDAAHAMQGWQGRLTDFQAKARQYEQQAEEARRRLQSAEGNPDLELAGRHFDTDAALKDAQARLDAAGRQLRQAEDELQDIISRARELLAEHEAAAREVAGAIRRAAEGAPDKPGLFDRMLDSLKDLGKSLQKLADDVWQWVQDHADTIYKIGDWLGVASAVCDVLAVVFSETVVGAVVFEAIGMALNGAALAFHGVGYAAGAKDASLLDLGLDVAGFVPFGDVLKLGKTGWGALKGVKISTDLLGDGHKAFKAAERAGDIIDAVGGTARNIAPDGAKFLHISADTFKDRLKVAVAKNFGDAGLWNDGFKARALDKALPRLIESTPLKHLPGAAGAVERVTDGAGKVVHEFVDPRSWVSRGAEAVVGAKNVYKEVGRAMSPDIDHLSDSVHDRVDAVRRGWDRIVDPGGLVS